MFNKVDRPILKKIKSTASQPRNYIWTSLYRFFQTNHNPSLHQQSLLSREHTEEYLGRPGSIWLQASAKKKSSSSRPVTVQNRSETGHRCCRRSGRWGETQLSPSSSRRHQESHLRSNWFHGSVVNVSISGLLKLILFNYMVVRKRAAAASAVVVIVWLGINPHNTVGIHTGSNSLEDNYWSPRCAFGHRLRLGLHEIQSPTWKDGTREELLISLLLLCIRYIVFFFARIYTFSSSVVHEHETYSK